LLSSDPRSNPGGAGRVEPQCTFASDSRCDQCRIAISNHTIVE
jgi:hypothetical protein